jgi:Phage integrase, N-terminal SAM-like domain
MQAPKSPFLNSLYRYMSVRYYSKRTIETYLHWIKLFVMYHGKRHPSAMGNSEIESFLTHLSVDRTVSQATQCAALNALTFLYNKFLNQPLGDVSAFQRSRKQPKLPVVLTLNKVLSDFFNELR